MNPIAPTEASNRLSQPASDSAPNAGGNGVQPGHAHLYELVEQIQELPDLAARELAQECLHSVLELYGSGLAQVLQLVQNAGESARPILDALVRDKLLRSLLLVHGLHPVDLETRLREALEKNRPYMQSHGGSVELLSLEGGVARLRFNGTCKTCPSSTVTMELAIRSAVEEACPDLVGLELEGAAPVPQPVPLRCEPDIK